MSSLVTGRSNPLPAVFFTQIPGRKKTRGREGLSRSLKRKLAVQAFSPAERSVGFPQV